MAAIQYPGNDYPITAEADLILRAFDRAHWLFNWVGGTVLYDENRAPIVRFIYIHIWDNPEVRNCFIEMSDLMRIR